MWQRRQPQSRDMTDRRRERTQSRPVPCRDSRAFMRDIIRAPVGPSTSSPSYGTTVLANKSKVGMVFATSIESVLCCLRVVLPEQLRPSSSNKSSWVVLLVANLMVRGVISSTIIAVSMRSCSKCESVRAEYLNIAWLVKCLLHIIGIN